MWLQGNALSQWNIIQTRSKQLHGTGMPEVLLSGSFAHSVVMMEKRAPSQAGTKWEVAADVESLEWDPHNEHSFVVSPEDGTIQGFDMRAAASNSSSLSKPSFTLHAHDKAVCTISYNPSAANLLASGSTDKMVKLWDISNNQPSCVASKDPKAHTVLPLQHLVSFGLNLVSRAFEFQALFRALKTKHATPIYGLIFHTSLNSREKFIDVAAKTALAI